MQIHYEQLVYGVKMCAVRCIQCVLYNAKCIQCVLYDVYNVCCTMQMYTMCAVRCIQCVLHDVYNVCCTMYTMYFLHAGS